LFWRLGHFHTKRENYFLNFCITTNTGLDTKQENSKNTAANNTIIHHTQALKCKIT